MPTEKERRELVAAFERALGSEAAATVMESLPPVPWNELATKADLLATKSDLKAAMADLRVEVAGVKVEIAEVKVEMAELTAEVHSLTPKLVIASLGTSATFMAMVMGAAALIR